jgi:hypothetical protein
MALPIARNVMVDRLFIMLNFNIERIVSVTVEHSTAFSVNSEKWESRNIQRIKSRPNSSIITLL